MVPFFAATFALVTLIRLLRSCSSLQLVTLEGVERPLRRIRDLDDHWFSSMSSRNENNDNKILSKVGIEKMTESPRYESRRNQTVMCLPFPCRPTPSARKPKMKKKKNKEKLDQSSVCFAFYIGGLHPYEALYTILYISSAFLLCLVYEMLMSGRDGKEAQQEEMNVLFCKKCIKSCRHLQGVGSGDDKGRTKFGKGNLLFASRINKCNPAPASRCTSGAGYLLHEVAPISSS